MSDPIPYGRHWIMQDDLNSVLEVLQSNWLTTGPKIQEFESLVAQTVGVQFGVAVSSGTAALHAAINAIDIGPGDEVIVPSLTFAATANAVVYEGGTPIFADVEPGTLLIHIDDVVKKITSKTKAIVAVDYAGHSCDYDSLKNIAEAHDLWLISDACHALGGKYKNKNVGSLADLTVFSFHPVKVITTGEGGFVATDHKDLAEKMRRFRNHGISVSHQQRSEKNAGYYEMVDLGFNYRISDLQAALGISQMGKLGEWIRRRNALASLYQSQLENLSSIIPLSCRSDILHAYHLFVVRIGHSPKKNARNWVFENLAKRNIHARVHYPPVHLHPYYQQKFGTKPGLLPNTEQAYQEILSLPLFPKMKDEDVCFVVEQLKQLMGSVLESA